jgi:hypothetical protein
MPGAIAVPSARSRQSSIRNTSSRSTATGSLSPRSMPGRRHGPRLAVAQQPRSHRRCRRDAGNHEASLPPGAGAPRRQRFGRRGAVEPVPIEHRGHRQLVLQRDLKLIATLEAKMTIGAWASSDHIGVSVPRTQGERAGPGLQRREGRPCAARSEAGPEPRTATPNPARSSRRSSGKISICHDRCGPFSGCYVQLTVQVRPGPEKAIFLLRNGAPML